jgi:hypothetical protein
LYRGQVIHQATCSQRTRSRSELAATFAAPSGLLHVDDEPYEVHDKAIAIELDQSPDHIGAWIDAAPRFAINSLRDHNHPDG